MHFFVILLWEGETGVYSLVENISEVYNLGVLGAKCGYSLTTSICDARFDEGEQRIN